MRNDGHPESGWPSFVAGWFGQLNRTMELKISLFTQR